MSVFILNQARFSLEDKIDVSGRGDLRKATPNMLMAYAVLEKLLKPFLAVISKYPDKTGVLLGTGHGDLETTKEYFKAYRKQSLARPLLFQNSLHNSTLGFLCQMFHLTGAAITHSDHYFSGEKVLETARLLLEQKQCSFCLVIGIDLLVPELLESLKLMYPSTVELGEGCAAVLLANEEGREKCLQTFSVVSSLKLDQIEYSLKKNADFANKLQNYYDANAIELLVKAIEKDNVKKDSICEKPDGTFSVLRFYE